ncbi:hypothetical protein Tco_1532048 [Tanacetum coccineum]
MDSIIPLGQKNTLAEYMILSGADNRPPMLDKDLYDSWKSRMELYMQNREHGRMILESVENGPLIWPTIEENGVTRTKKYAELSAAEKIQADCDMKATNIILQGLPADIYSLVNHHRVAKDLWERVQLLMQGTSLTKQERECKLYDAFDKFTHIKGESLHKYYLRFTQLINDMQLMTTCDEGSECATNEGMVLSRERNEDVSCMGGNSEVSTPTPIRNRLSVLYNIPQLQEQCPPIVSLVNYPRYVPQIVYQSPQVATQPMTKSPLEDSGFAVPVFYSGDDPIACLNKAMTFLTPVSSSRFPSTNNQLKTSSNPRKQHFHWQGHSATSSRETGLKLCLKAPKELLRVVYKWNLLCATSSVDKQWLKLLMKRSYCGGNDGELDIQLQAQEAQLQDKDSTICKLKDIIKSLREKSKEENVNYDYCEIETKNVELENKNEDLKAQIQDKVFVITSLKNDLRKVKGKEIVDIAAQNREAHIDYLK